MLADLADATGLSAALFEALAPLRQRDRGHDPGRVAVDLAVMLADGGEPARCGSSPQSFRTGRSCTPPTTLGPGPTDMAWRGGQAPPVTLRRQWKCSRKCSWTPTQANGNGGRYRYRASAGRTPHRWRRLFVDRRSAVTDAQRLDL
jgi:hypothetical protein